MERTFRLAQSGRLKGCWRIEQTNWAEVQLSRGSFFTPMEILLDCQYLLSRSLGSNVMVIVAGFGLLVSEHSPFTDLVLGSIHGVDWMPYVGICGLSMLVLFSDPRGFPPGYSSFPSPQKHNIWHLIAFFDL